MKSPTDSLIIRPLSTEDLATQYRMVTDPRIARNLMQTPSMEMAQTEEWLATVAPDTHRLAAVWNGRHVGTVNLRQYPSPRLRHLGSMGIFVDPDFWGRGVGRALMDATLNLADNWLNLTRVQLEVYPENETAVRLYERCGFELEGRKRMAAFGDGRYLDTLVMARLRNDAHLPRQSPLPQVTPPTGPIDWQKLEIRPWQTADLPRLHALFTHPAICRTTLQLPSHEYHAFVQRRAKRVANGHRLVAVMNEQVLGAISIFIRENPRTKHVGDLGMMVHPDYWGVGIGSRLMTQILDLADNWLNLLRVELEVNTDNPAAVRLYEKFGFAREGTLRCHAFGDGRMADSYFMGRLKQKPENDYR